MGDLPGTVQLVGLQSTRIQALTAEQLGFSKPISSAAGFRIF